MPLLLEEYYKNYTRHLQELMKRVDLNVLEEAIEWLLKAWERSHTVFFIGNGGSAATASHFAQDLALIGRKLKVKPFRSLSLTDNTSFITASGNDYGYDTIFTSQLEGLIQKEDLLVAISASGNSPNIIAATWYARQKGCKTIALLGFDGGKLKQLADLAIHVRSDMGEYGAVEDCHSMLNHFITTVVSLKLKEEFTAAGVSVQETTLRPDLV